MALGVVEWKLITDVVVVVAVGKIDIGKNESKLVGSEVDERLDEGKPAVAVAAAIVVVVMALWLCDVVSLAVFGVGFLQLSSLLRS